MKEKILIVQASVAGTGSTFLSNALYGFMLPERGIDFRPYLPPRELTQSVTIVKTHSMRFEDFMCDAADVYFVCTERSQPVGSIPGRTLVVHYYDILESTENTLERIVDFLYAKLKEFLPDHIVLQRDRCLARLRAMNAEYEKIKDRPFSYFDHFFQLHGSHRGRWAD